MFRYAKDKILYMTLESNIDCRVGITVDHNKKEAPGMTVTSMQSSQENMGVLKAKRNSTTSLTSASIRPNSRDNKVDTNNMNEEEMAAKAEETVLALKHMLGED